MTHSEFAVIKDNGIKNDYRVNFQLVNSKAYHDKFVGLTEHKALDEAIYKQAAKMLEHRSGTEYEDIAMLDARTGEIIVQNDTASGDMKHKCGLTDKQAKLLSDNGVCFEILHNHPSSSIPSSDDIKWLFKREKATGSTIICHNGSIYSLRKIKVLSNPDEVIDAVYNKIKETYPSWSKEQVEYVAVKQIVKRLEHSGHMKYICK